MNNKMKQFIAFGVCSVVALALCLGVLVITVNNVDSNTDVTDNKTIINKLSLFVFSFYNHFFIHKIVSS